MLSISGVFIIFTMVFGGYILAGGKIAIILQASPFELMIILGAACGALLISGDKKSLISIANDFALIFKGKKWKEGDYTNLLCLLFALTKVAKQNPVQLEEHIENPNNSEIFSKFPKLLKDKECTNLICDTFRSASMNYDNPNQVEDTLDKRIMTHFEKEMMSTHALQSTADALPALGIVAAVLGVIKTMASIDQPPEILGKMIGGALVGTFLGVFIAYGIVAPFAQKIKHIKNEDMHFIKVIREVLVAHLHQHPANISVEVGRQSTPEHLRPSYDKLENAVKLSR